MERHRFGRAVAVFDNALGALRAGSEDGIGVSVVCGTGAAERERVAASLPPPMVFAS